jgi:citrate synthase
VVADISEIDVKEGKLLYRGHDATNIAMNYTFEEAFFLLIYGRLPDAIELEGFIDYLSSLRKRNEIIQLNTGEKNIISIADVPSCLNGMNNNSNLTWKDRACQFAAVLPDYVALTNMKLIPAAGAQDTNYVKHSQHVLNLLSRNSSLEDLHDFEVCLILHMDDPNNPSLSALEREFKETGSTHQALEEALTHHINPLHHGAGYESFKMLQELHQAKSVRKALERRLEDGKRIFGMGHRIYKTIDPRARVLEEILQRRTEGTDQYWMHETASQVAVIGAEVILDSKGIRVYPNLDLYNAAVYSTFGISPELNTDLFAISRAAGWVSHLIEMHD